MIVPHENEMEVHLIPFLIVLAAGIGIVTFFGWLPIWGYIVAFAILIITIILMFQSLKTERKEGK